MQYTVSGSTKMGRETQPFEKELSASSEKHARELVYNFFGSKHGISRTNVDVDSIEKA